MSQTAFFASGCFWGTQYHLDKTPGVIETHVGYTGGHGENPTYEEVCRGKTGHVEAVEVLYDETKTNYETLATLFFETHDPTQTDGQGPDIGSQYHSVIFYTNDEQKMIAEKLIKQLENKGMNIATIIKPAATFWRGEQYHEKYYEKRGGSPYCHIYTKRF